MFDVRRSVSLYLVLLFFSVLIPHVHAQVMQSSNYRLQSDSVNIGGGFSSSTSYALESTTGEIGTGQSDSTSFSLRAGYQQMQTVYLSLSAPANVSLEPAIGGLTGGISSGTTSVTAITDSPGGYQITIEAANDPAMQSTINSIADYAPDTSNPDYNFSYGSNEALLAFSPSGAHIVNRFRDNTSACGTGGTNDTPGFCWDGLSATPQVIAQSNDANHPTGTATNVAFRVGIGSQVGQVPGVYVATTTVTLLAL